MFSQATVDFMDLLTDVSSGRGRPALRVARSLIEEYVAALDCATDPEAAERWLASSSAADLAIGRLRLPERHLRGKVVQGHRHRVRSRQKRAAPAMDRAVKRWGSSFRRSWHHQSLRDRAHSHGLDDHYAFYRLASAPVHATSGGSVGLRRVRRDGHPTIRTGTALEPAPLAVLYGTDAMRGVLTQIRPYAPDAVDRVLVAVSRLDDCWEELYVGLREIDEALWPRSEPVNRAVLIVQEPDNSVRYFEYLPEIHLARSVPDGMRVNDAQLRAIEQLATYLDLVPHPRVGVFVHEAVPAHPPTGDVGWEPVGIELDRRLHVFVDGTVGIPPEPDDEPVG